MEAHGLTLDEKKDRNIFDKFFVVQIYDRVFALVVEQEIGFDADNFWNFYNFKWLWGRVGRGFLG